MPHCHRREPRESNNAIKNSLAGRRRKMEMNAAGSPALGRRILINSAEAELMNKSKCISNRRGRSQAEGPFICGTESTERRTTVTQQALDSTGLDYATPRSENKHIIVR
ncbi:hypothetical protein NDU88_006306 [Pleurodeles waltl]|uniref:Uncharacterized protein n=1 Tax=Pleurodeles waltl TaxID=8319 RepID=A0AAV7MYW4_PLEWA|nr:hypothetical protein NDU88_006306 [Pleurodeles waltl]